MPRVGQNRICTPYMTVCKVISLLKLSYVHRICVCMYGFGKPYSYPLIGLIDCSQNTSRQSSACSLVCWCLVMVFFLIALHHRSVCSLVCWCLVLVLFLVALHHRLACRFSCHIETFLHLVMDTLMGQGRAVDRKLAGIYGAYFGAADKLPHR
jgi:hypothetical protein